MKSNFILVLILALTLVGCATTQIKGHADLLNFLADGKTTKEEVLVQLGQPSGKFEQEKILTYRLGFDSRSRGYYVVERARGMGSESTWEAWMNCKYSLVLVFDNKDVLGKHSLVEVLK
jgi:hypothetical protein